MLLVPMEGWRHRLMLQAQRLVSIGRQFAGKAWPALPVLSLSTQPKAQEDFAFHAEGDIVLAKRLVFGHAWQRKRIAPYFFYIHLLSDSFCSVIISCSTTISTTIFDWKIDSNYDSNLDWNFGCKNNANSRRTSICHAACFVTIFSFKDFLFVISIDCRYLIVPLPPERTSNQ